MAGPITSVTPCTKAGVATGAAVTTLPVPYKYTHGLHDISDAEAGRVISMTMNKNRKGQARSIDLAWRQVPLADAASILSAYNSEYVICNCLDSLTGTHTSKRYYVGDRKSELAHNGLWESVSFTIIQQVPDKV